MIFEISTFLLWIMVIFFLTGVVVNLMQMYITNIHLVKLRKEILMLDGIVEEEEKESLSNKISNFKMFDKLYAKNSAQADPYNSAWEGKPDPNSRRKTA